MLIDWFTVIAQVFNFLVLVILLKWLLYDRVLEVIDKRQQRIDEDLASAEEKHQQAEEKREKYEQQQEEFYSRQEQLKQEARDEAKELRDIMESEAREEIEQRRRRWQQSLRQQQDSFLTDLRQTAAEQLEKTTRQVLNDLADAELENQIVRIFIRRISDIEGDKLDQLEGLAREKYGRSKVISAFELDHEVRDELRNTLLSKIKGLEEVEFSKDNGLICGIEARLNGLAIAWSIESYLEEFSVALKERIRSKAGNENPNEKDGDE